MSSAMTLVQPTSLETFRFTQDQRRLILDTCCNGAPQHEAAALIGIAEMRGLNPLTQECYFVQRWDSQKNRMVWAVQISIDAMRIKAEESGLYAGQDEPEYEYEPGNKVPVLARVRVYRKDWQRPCVGVARYDEYVQKRKDGQPTRFWKDMPHNQLAKVAESLALRKAFPARLAKLYTPEEMAQASNDAPAHDDVTGEVIEAPSPARRRSDPPPAPEPTGPTEVQRTAFAKLADGLRLAQSLPDLQNAWKAIGPALKGEWITLSQRAELQDIKDRCKAELSRIKTPAEIHGDNELPPEYGGPPRAKEPDDGEPPYDYKSDADEGPR